MSELAGGGNSGRCLLSAGVFRTLKATHEFPYFVRAFSKSGPVLEVFLVGKGESMYNSIHSADFVIMDCREKGYTW